MLRQWLMALIGTFCCVTILYAFGPDVAADYLDSGKVEVVDSFDIEPPRCKTYAFVLTHCATTLKERGKPAAEPLHFSHIYLGRFSDESVQPVAIGAQQPRLSVSIGIQHLGGRIAVMMIAALAATASLIGCCRMAEMRDPE